MHRDSAARTRKGGMGYNRKHAGNITIRASMMKHGRGANYRKNANETMLGECNMQHQREKNIDIMQNARRYNAPRKDIARHRKTIRWPCNPKTPKYSKQDSNIQFLKRPQANPQKYTKCKAGSNRLPPVPIFRHLVCAGAWMLSLQLVALVVSYTDGLPGFST